MVDAMHRVLYLLGLEMVVLLSPKEKRVNNQEFFLVRRNLVVLKLKP